MVAICTIGDSAGDYGYYSDDGETGGRETGTTIDECDGNEVTVQFGTVDDGLRTLDTLAEIGVPYELVLVERDADGRPSDEYLALNPWGKIPTLEDGDLVLTGKGGGDIITKEQFDSYELVRDALGPEDRATVAAAQGRSCVKP